MARLRNGALGGFSGKVGSIVGYRLRNNDFIKGLPKPSTKPATLKQLASRARFKFFNEWRNPLTDFFAVTFKNQTANHSAQNAAHSCNRDIIVGEYPNYDIDYEKVVISKGDLINVQDLSMELVQPDYLRFSWKPNYKGKAKGTDLLAILICYPGDNTQLFGTLNGADRAAGTYDFKIDFLEPGTRLEVYATFLSNDRSRACDSTYMGRIDI
ncbi:DUF6266 family protein [Pedobacter mucosus]|uniref:DUF6266 family protein n=1 Tax=Pedobacter mucosus TaxID=2895286 RepID=UPI001EE41BC6|nr:DUF6266 family protein [Pedobacter mucosus]UKT64069.1 DUF6266 family protein [Pedobacter mucosus]